MGGNAGESPPAAAGVPDAERGPVSQSTAWRRFVSAGDRMTECILGPGTRAVGTSEGEAPGRVGGADRLRHTASPGAARPEQRLRECVPGRIAFQGLFESNMAKRVGLHGPSDIPAALFVGFMLCGMAVALAHLAYLVFGIRAMLVAAVIGGAWWLKAHPAPATRARPGLKDSPDFHRGLRRRGHLSDGKR